MQAGDNKSYDDINVTPMVDLYLVLLLIFIIMTIVLLIKPAGLFGTQK